MAVRQGRNPYDGFEEGRSHKRDLQRALREWDGSWPPAWRPDPGEILVGTVIRYSVGPTAYGDVRTAIVESEDGSGRVAVWLSPTVLLSLFDQQRPRIGERIGIRYLGKHPDKGYRMYDLLVDREDGELDFSPPGGESDRG